MKFITQLITSVVQNQRSLFASNQVEESAVTQLFFEECLSQKWENEAILTNHFLQNLWVPAKDSSCLEQDRFSENRKLLIQSFDSEF